jgi:hypothetical protein
VGLAAAYALFSGSVRNATPYATMRKDFGNLNREIEPIRVKARRSSG